MSVIALALDASTEDRLLADIIEHGHRVAARLGSSHELIAMLDSGRPDAVLVSATPMLLRAELLVECDRRGIRIVAMARDDAERRHAAALGLHEVVDAGAAWSEVEAALGSGVPLPAQAETRGAGARGASTVIAVWGPGGAPGRTTVAVNIAAEIAACGHTVALVDADSYGGTIAPVLGILDEAPGFAAACRLSATGSLNRVELERVARRYNSPRGSFWVLTGIGRAERWPELGAVQVAATLGTCREWVEYVVVDIGFCLENDEEISSDLFAPRRNAAALTVLREADRVVAVGLADPIGMSRFLRAHAELPDVATTTSISVVMNRVRASAVGLDPQGQVRQTLRRFGGIDAATLVPHDLNGVDTAVLDGRTLRDTAPRSAARRAIHGLVVGELLPQAVQGGRRGISWPRPRSAGGAGGRAPGAARGTAPGSG